MPKVEKSRSSAGKFKSAITGRYVTSKSGKAATRVVTTEGLARLRARGASEEFLNAAQGKR